MTDSLLDFQIQRNSSLLDRNHLMTLQFPTGQPMSFKSTLDHVMDSDYLSFLLQLLQLKHNCRFFVIVVMCEHSHNLKRRESVVNYSSHYAFVVVFTYLCNN